MPRETSPIETLRAPIEGRVADIRGFRAAKVLSYDPLTDSCSVVELVYADEPETYSDVPVLRFESLRRDLTVGQHVLLGNFERDHTDYLATGVGGPVEGSAHRISPFAVPVSRLSDPSRVDLPRDTLTAGEPGAPAVPLALLSEVQALLVVLTALAAGTPTDPITRGMIATALTPPLLFTGAEKLKVTG